MTKNQIIEQLKAEHPTLRIGDEESGYTNLDAEKYEATIEQWADNLIALQAAEAEAKAAEAKAAANKEALLAKLGITADEAKLLLS